MEGAAAARRQAAAAGVVEGAGAGGGAAADAEAGVRDGAAMLVAEGDVALVREGPDALAAADPRACAAQGGVSTGPATSGLPPYFGEWHVTARHATARRVEATCDGPRAHRSAWLLGASGDVSNLLHSARRPRLARWRVPERAARRRRSVRRDRVSYDFLDPAMREKPREGGGVV